MEHNPNPIDPDTNVQTPDPEPRKENVVEPIEDVPAFDPKDKPIVPQVD